MEKQSFIFYIDWYDYLKDEPDDFRLQMFDTIMKYVFDGIEPAEPSVKRDFKLIKAQLDRDKEKYKETCKKRTEAINKRWEAYKSKQNNTDDTNEYKCIEMNTNDTNRTDNVNGNGNVNVNEDNKKTPKGVKEIAAACAATLAKVKQEFYNELIPYVDLYGKEMIREFYDYWTEPNKSQTKIRKQLEKTWDTDRRLRTWSNKESKYNNGNTNKQTNGATSTEIASLVGQMLNEVN